jgi:hypothetical protein
MGMMVDYIYKDEFVSLEIDGETTFYEQMDFVHNVPSEIDWLNHEMIVFEKCSEEYGAYRTAPDYLDRTDLTVHNTEEEAKRYLCETYHDEIEGEEGCEICEKELEKRNEL